MEVYLSVQVAVMNVKVAAGVDQAVRLEYSGYVLFDGLSFVAVGVDLVVNNDSHFGSRFRLTGKSG